MTSFIPRSVFPALESLPRSYYLGHHHAGLQKMKTRCSSVDLILECRDYRIPITSKNPLFEDIFAERERIIVYTKTDLGVDKHYRATVSLPFAHSRLRFVVSKPNFSYIDKATHREP